MFSQEKKKTPEKVDNWCVEVLIEAMFGPSKLL